MALTHQQAERAMARAMQNMGFGDARAMPGGPDGGIDVRSRSAVAQVKHHRTKVGRPDLQRLYGARGTSSDKQMLFFSRSGYSNAAVDYAAGVDMALFVFDDSGNVRGLNAPAKKLNARNASWAQGDQDVAKGFGLLLTFFGVIIAVPAIGFGLEFNLVGWIILVAVAGLILTVIARE